MGVKKHPVPRNGAEMKPTTVQGGRGAPAKTVEPDPFGYRGLPTKRLVNLLLQYREWETLTPADAAWLGFSPPPRSYSSDRLREIRGELCRRRRRELAGVPAR